MTIARRRVLLFANLFCFLECDSAWRAFAKSDDVLHIGVLLLLLKVVPGVAMVVGCFLLFFDGGVLAVDVHNGCL